MPSPKFQVLILTQQGREGFLEQLLPELDRQIKGHAAEVLLSVHDPKLTLGDNRNRQLREATAEYIAFVDDDDWVAPDYFHRIMPLLDSDTVGFRVQLYTAYKGYTKYCLILRGLKYGPATDPFHGGLSHLHPIRRELALQAKFDAGQGEDYRWGTKLWTLGIVKSENYIDDVMYHYFWRAAKDDKSDPSNPMRLAIIGSLKSKVP